MGLCFSQNGRNKRVLIKKIKPDYNIESIYNIDIEHLLEYGVKALFFDLDSTIMKSKSGKFNFRTLQFLNDLRRNFKIAIITNNTKMSYLKQVRSQTDIPIYAKAKKPDPRALLKACRDFKIQPVDAVMIGDRPLSDMLAGKRAGTMTILVDSIAKDEEGVLVRFVRFLERLTIAKE